MVPVMYYYIRQINKMQENTKVDKSAGKTCIPAAELCADTPSAAREEDVSES